eukprot:TRINITY_DN7079_c0_g1_i10.p1 TRINITY_DN7079_c0_g1~~TRINITY_DN7079_c0_g1_i10.p1  ORF type:complete len:534 (+),score=43.93 TRINITY_DN7079_c0_g1_i10:68-1669(+)
MASTGNEELILIGCVTVLTFNICLLARSLSHGLRYAWSLKAEICKRCRSWWNRALEKDPSDEYVDREVERYLVQNIQRVLLVSRHVSCVVISLVLFNTHIGEERTLSDIQVLLVIIGSVATTFGSTVEYLVNATTVHIWYATLLVFTGLFVLASDSQHAEVVQNWNLQIIPLRLMLSISYVRRPVVFIFNFLNSMACVYAFTRASSFCAEETARLFDMIQWEIVVVIGISYLSSTTESSLRAQIASTLKVTCLQGEGKAMMRLLDLVCDVVVELDCHQCMSEHSKRFSALLALGPTFNTKGVHLECLMPSADDRLRFREMLDSASTGINSVPSVTHVTLRDGRGMRFQAQVFCVHFRGLRDSSRFYIGIQESQDVPVTNLENVQNSRRSRRMRASSHNRTEEVGIGSNAGDSQTSAIEAAESSELGVSVGKGLLHTHWQPTSYEGKRLGLMSSMISWNFKMDSHQCCAYHAACNEVLSVVASMKQEPCKVGFKTEFTAQCTNCGSLEDWNNVCDSLECPTCTQQGMTQGTQSL